MIDYIYSQFINSIDLIRQRKNILVTRGIMMSDDVVLIELMNEICTLKKEYVLKRHVNKDGTPKSIHQKDLGEGLVWVTYLKRKRITGETEKVVYDKLFKIYAKDDPNINLDDFNYLDNNFYSFKEMFELGLEKWEIDHNVTSDNDFTPEQISARNTARRIRQAYKTYITDDFAKTDIRIIISGEFLHNYTIETLDRYQKNDKYGRMVKKKAFNEHYKRVLRIALDYAKRKHYINSNPMDEKGFLSYRDYSKRLDCHKKKTKEEVIPESTITEMTEDVRKRIQRNRERGICYINGFMYLIAKNTGLRIGELSGLKETDVDLTNHRLHVHSQELIDQDTHIYAVVEYTKDENIRQYIEDGRDVPLLPETEDDLRELFKIKKEVGIISEWLFADEDGNRINKSQYEQFLRKLCRRHGCGTTRNHGLRKSYNSYCLVPSGIPSSDRAKILGQSIETNEKYYTFERLDYCDIAREKILNARKAEQKDNQNED